MSTNTIEFSRNSQSNWFVVMYDDTIINSIKDIAKQFKVECTKAFNYTRPENRWVMYFNVPSLPTAFVEAIKSQFKVLNTTPKEAAARIDRGIQVELAERRARINLNKFDVLDIKYAMVDTIGSAAQIKQSFADHGFKLVGHATKHQCIELLIKTDLTSRVLNLLRNPEQIDTVVPEVLAEDIPDFWEVVEASPNDDRLLSVDEVEIVIRGLCLHQTQNLLVSGRVGVPQFEPWTTEELYQFSMAHVRELARLDGIDLKGTSQLRQAQLIAYVLPLLNQVGAEQHANG